MGWTGWPLSRVLLLFTGIAFLMIFIQVTLFHYRQNFRHWAQWLPVLAVPVLGVTALAVGFFNVIWLRMVLMVLLFTGLAAGIFGFVLHVEGVGERVDGYRMQNFLVGPPITLPLMVAAISLLGLIALYWR